MHAGDRSATEETLRAGYRPIRHMTAAESPWPGTLTRTPDGQSSVLVDAVELGDDWGGWHAEEGGHVLAPLDVVRRLDGHDVALPVCSERVDAFLARRGSGRDALDGGEAVTLAVSLLRGAAEVARHAGDDPSIGEWWLTDEGRPVLATDIAGRPTSEVLESLATSVDAWLGRVIADAAATATDPRVLLRDIDECEAALFAVAAPLPLAMNAFTPLHGRDAAPGPAADEAEDVPPPRWVDSLARHIDADLTELVSDTFTRVWRGVRRPRAANHRRPWIIAAGLAGGILGLGLLWPSGGGPATAEGSVPTPTSTSTEAGPSGSAVSDAPDQEQHPAAVDPVPASGDVDWAVAAAGLLTRRAACAGELGCLADIVEDPTRAFPAGVADRSGADVRITLLDEFGGAAVLRVEDPADAATTPQLVVVVRAQERLLLRDIHDVAEKKA
ncbi:hypothetical protein [uncultured Microbacterium sp.]|uniref:hypothetical protein n=1 Tax=uncultured Microbacterium sp. TaxID=191216 RepID=UPI0035CA4947